MEPNISRRRLLRGAAIAAVAAPMAPLLSACGGDDDGGGSSNDKVQLNIFWWGADKRAELTQKVLDLYTAKHPNVTFKPTWQGFTGYYDKLGTLAAGGNAPDIFQIDDNGLTEYAERGLTLDLTKYTDAKKIDVSKFPEGLVSYAKVGDKMAAIPTAENTAAMVYDKTLAQQLGLPEPTIGMSWENLIAWGKQVTDKSKGKIYGTMDASADYKALWIWLRQQGKEFYNGKQLGFTADDLTAWFDMWKAARDSKAAPPADIVQVANAGDVTKQLVITGKAATSFMWSNQVPEMATKTKNQLGIVSYPGDPKGQWPRASMYFSIYKGSKHADAAADFINFFVNNPEAATILGTERGLPCNSDLRTQIASSATDPNMKTTIDFENTITPQFGKAPVPPPKGHTAIRKALQTAAESEQFGKASTRAAAESFIKEANTALSS
jgi:multiple sugar transport system substrate-binding protein